MHDLGHAFKEVDNILCLQLPKLPRRQYDPFGVVSNFTTMVKIKVFFNEEDTFDDFFSAEKHLQRSLAYGTNCF